LQVQAKPYNNLIIGSDERFSVDLYIDESGAYYRVVDSAGNVVIALTPLSYTTKQWFNLLVDFSGVTTVGFYEFQITNSNASVIFFRIPILRCTIPTGAYRWEFRKPNDTVALNGHIFWMYKQYFRNATNVALDVYQLNMPSGVDIQVIVVGIDKNLKKVFPYSFTISQITSNAIVYVDPQDYVDLKYTIGISDNLGLLKTLGHYVDPVLEAVYSNVGVDNLLGLYIVNYLLNHAQVRLQAYHIYPDKIELYLRFSYDEVLAPLPIIIEILIIIAVIVLGIAVSYAVITVSNNQAKIERDKAISSLTNDYNDTVNKILSNPNLTDDQKLKALEIAKAFYTNATNQLTDPKPQGINWGHIALGVVGGMVLGRVIK